MIPRDPTPPKGDWRRRLRLLPRKARGTQQLSAGRPSEHLDRLIRAGFISLLELVGLVLLCTVMGAWIWDIWAAGPDGQRVLTIALTVVAVTIWVVLTKERAHQEQKRSIRDEQERRANSTDQPRDRAVRMGSHSDAGPPTQRWSIDDPPTRRFKPVDPTIELPPRSDFEQQFDQHPDWDQPV